MDKQTASETAAIWTALPSILWVALAAIVLFFLRKSISELIEHFILRVRSGVAMKIGFLDIAALQTEQLHVPTAITSSSAAPEVAEAELDHSHESAHAALQAAAPETNELNIERQRYYDDSRRIMVVHRLFRSTRPGQVYDVLIYLTPQGRGSLIEVSKVEYFFGRYWGNQIFTSNDRSRGFPILTSAYGTFLCCVRVTFNDGERRALFRYIDFEMGAYAPVLLSKQKADP